MNPPSFFNFAATDTRPAVRVRSLRNMICRPLGCDPRPVGIGEELTIAAATLDQLGSEDIEVIAAAEILDVRDIEATDVSELEAADFIEAGEFIEANEI